MNLHQIRNGSILLESTRKWHHTIRTKLITSCLDTDKRLTRCLTIGIILYSPRSDQGYSQAGSLRNPSGTVPSALLENTTTAESRLRIAHHGHAQAYNRSHLNHVWFLRLQFRQFFHKPEYPILRTLSHRTRISKSNPPVQVLLSTNPRHQANPQSAQNHSYSSDSQM